MRYPFVLIPTSVSPSNSVFEDVYLCAIAVVLPYDFYNTPLTKLAVNEQLYIVAVTGNLKDVPTFDGKVFVGNKEENAYCVVHVLNFRNGVCGKPIAVVIVNCDAKFSNVSIFAQLCSPYIVYILSRNKVVLVANKV